MDLNFLTLALAFLLYALFCEHRRQQDVALLAALWNNYLAAVQGILAQITQGGAEACCCPPPAQSSPPGNDPLSPDADEEDSDDGPGPR